VVGLPDVNKYFAGIEQVIHGDRVEAGLEFIEEESLDEQQKDLDEPEDEAAAQKPRPMPSAAEAPVRHNQHPAQQRYRLGQRCEDVPV
jgi:hypothetical protein